MIIKFRSSSRPAFTLIELLVVIAIIGVLVALLLPAVQKARESARRVQCMNNLKQIGIGLHAYYDANSELPYGSDWTGAPAKSPTWAAMILPFIERQAHYDLFDFNNTMDHANNAVAVTTVVPTYLCPSDPASLAPVRGARCTCCGTNSPVKALAIWYPGSMGPTPCNNCVFCPDTTASPTNFCCQGSPCGGNGTGVGMFMRFKKAIKFTDVTDGLSNTFMCGEALPDQNMHNTAFAVNMPVAVTNIPLNLMAMPSEMPLDTMSDATLHSVNSPDRMMGFKSRHPEGAQFLLGDGSVRFVVKQVDFQTYNALGTRAGAELFELP